MKNIFLLSKPMQVALHREELPWTWMMQKESKLRAGRNYSSRMVFIILKKDSQEQICIRFTTWEFPQLN